MAKKHSKKNTAINNDDVKEDAISKESEEKIDIDYGNNIHFTGIIDKILYDNYSIFKFLVDEDGETIV